MNAYIIFEAYRRLCSRGRRKRGTAERLCHPRHVIDIDDETVVFDAVVGHRRSRADIGQRSAARLWGA